MKHITTRTITTILVSFTLFTGCRKDAIQEIQSDNNKVLNEKQVNNHSANRILVITKGVDLIISNVKWSMNESVLKITVTNQGSVEAGGFKIMVKYNCNNQPVFKIINIPAKLLGSVEVSVPFEYSCYIRSGKIDTMADYEYVVREANETNNSRTFYLAD